MASRSCRPRLATACTIVLISLQLASIQATSAPAPVSRDELALLRVELADQLVMAIQKVCAVLSELQMSVEGCLNFPSWHTGCHSLSATRTT
jgi:hypothetical protein